MTFKPPFSAINEFIIGELIQEGPYSAVYQGYQSNLQRDVLIKLLKPGSSAKLKKRFEREAQVYARLSHPNIVSVFALGEKDGYLYIILEYVHGTSLAALLAKDSILPDRIIWQLGCDVLEALKHAAQSKVVHRDIKPANILIDKQGRIKVADFGLALIEDQTGLTEQEGIVGTPAFMSPEQITGTRVDERSDIFSFGAVIYQMLYGQQAFAGESFAITINKILNETPQFLEQKEGASKKINDFLITCLNKNRDQRWQSAGHALQEWQGLKDEMSSGPPLTKWIQLRVAPEKVKTKHPQAKKREKKSLRLIYVFLIFFILALLYWWIQPAKNGDNNVRISESIESKNDSISLDRKTGADSVSEKVIGNTIKQAQDSVQFDTQPASQIKENSPPILTEAVKDENTELAELDIKITPWAMVYIDDSLIDSQMVSGRITLSEGMHQITFEHPRYAPEQQEFVLNAGELMQIEWSFWEKTGFLQIDVRPWADIYLDNEFIETTPLSKPIRIATGKRLLELRHPDLENYKENIEIFAGDTLSRKISLKSSGTKIE